MDRVLREYSHTAWTQADPLAGLDPMQRRAILLMPSTFRERFRLAPWVGRDNRLLIIRDIVAERRLMYDLFLRQTPDLEATSSRPTPNPEASSNSKDPQPAPSASVPDGPARSPTEPLSPYWQYRLDSHRAAIQSMAETRGAQDHDDIRTNPEARKDAERRAAALHAIAVERAKLDLRELEILAPKVTRHASSDAGAESGRMPSAESERIADRLPVKKPRKKRLRDRDK